MSQWTHVNASIRFDGIMGTGVPTEKDLGVICTWENWNETDMPCGSEGGIEYKIIKNTLESSLAAAVVVFYADLRDYDNVQEILDYFTKITKGKIIRSGVLEIDVEFKNPQVYRYERKKEVWVKYA